ncbi:neuronal acetylcholine receptor subunit alpha-7-like isoform X1 [Oncorhynchus nerka]|uniref:neuronal acetylcholine receptor subunit alpha-7-like isoform X1 n=1 Tax=Oncorhynchus nerka TaxID=8023 RepID=UPI0031B7F1C7
MRCRKSFGQGSVGIYLWMAVLFKGSLQGEHQRRLYKELMANYNRLERPVINDSSPLLVELGMTLLQIIDVDEKNQVLMTNAWLQLYWTDVYLSWNPEKYPGVQNLRFPSSQIWTPDILLYNSADERFDATFHTNVLVNASGYCQYIPPGILKSTCYIDVRWFPFDVQKCDLKFGSWTHNGWLLDLQMLDVDTSTYIPNGEWDLVGVPAKRNELYYDCCKEPYPDVTFTVTMRRRTLYYGLNLLIPCVLISGLALLVFLLPADSGEKISLGITVLLSLTVFMLLVAEIMPATSDSVPLIAQYFASTMMIVGLSVVVTVLVLQFHHHDPQGGKMPRWVSPTPNLHHIPHHSRCCIIVVFVHIVVIIVVFVLIVVVIIEIIIVVIIVVFVLIIVVIIVVFTLIVAVTIVVFVLITVVFVIIVVVIIVVFIHIIVVIIVVFILIIVVVIIVVFILIVVVIIVIFVLIIVVFVIIIVVIIVVFILIIVVIIVVFIHIIVVIIVVFILIIVVIVVFIHIIVVIIIVVIATVVCIIVILITHQPSHIVCICVLQSQPPLPPSSLSLSLSPGQGSAFELVCLVPAYETARRGA